MKVTDILKLIEAGYTKQEIDQMQDEPDKKVTNPESDPPADQELEVDQLQPSAVQENADEKNQEYITLKQVEEMNAKMIENIKTMIQENNIKTSTIDEKEPETVESLFQKLGGYE